MIPFRHLKYGLLMIASLILIFVVSTIIYVYRTEKERENYIIVTNSIYVNGVVVSKRSFGSACIVDLGENKEYLLYIAENYNYKPSLLSDFIELGDSIIKRENTDTILIYRGEKCYFFKSNESIGIK